MPCLIGLFAFFFPRVVLVILWLTGYLTGVFQTVLWPLLGFLFAPFTTLAYAYAIKANGSVSGLYLGLVILGVLLDLGVLGGGDKERRKRFKKRD